MSGRSGGGRSGGSGGGRSGGSGGGRSGGSGGGRSGGSVQVSGYTRSSGTYVAGYTRSAPTRSGSGTSGTGISCGSVQVSGYTRSDGTHVAGYTRSAPTRSSSGAGGRGTGTSSGSVEVSGYTRSDGTYVAGYTRSAPARGSSGASGTGTSSGSVEVKAYTRSDGTQVKGHKRSAPKSSKDGTVTEHRRSRATSSNTSSTSNKSSGEPQKCYVDNPFNRRFGRVGKLIGTHVIHADGTETVSDVPMPRRRPLQLVEENTIDDLIRHLEYVGFTDDRPDYQYALDKLEREQVQENWKKENIQLSTDVSQLSQYIPGMIPFGELRLEDRVIGRGGFGEVYAGLWHGTPVAFKKLLYQHISKKRKESFKTEISVLATINHPNTVKMFGAVIEEGNIGIVMEYLPRSLFQAIFIDEERFSDSKKKEIVSQMASALLYLHTHEPKIAHCDVKSENVLLDTKDNAKLGDFGLSALKNATESSRSTIVVVAPGQGTPRYSAPEVLRGEILDRIDQLFQADVYSLAVVVFEVVAGEEPFEDLNVTQLKANVGCGDLRPVARDIALAQPVTDLLQRSWDGSASKRPTIAEFQAIWSSITILYC